MNYGLVLMKKDQKKFKWYCSQQKRRLGQTKSRQGFLILNLGDRKKICNIDWLSDLRLSRNLVGMKWDNWFPGQDKELQQIFQGQSVVKEIITLSNNKIE